MGEPDFAGGEYGFTVERTVIDTDQVVEPKIFFQNEFPFVNGVPGNHTDMTENLGGLVEIQNRIETADGNI